MEGGGVERETLLKVNIIGGDSEEKILMYLNLRIDLTYTGKVISVEWDIFSRVSLGDSDRPWEIRAESGDPNFTDDKLDPKSPPKGAFPSRPSIKPHDVRLRRRLPRVKIYSRNHIRKTG